MFLIFTDGFGIFRLHPDLLFFQGSHSLSPSPSFLCPWIFFSQGSPSLLSSTSLAHSSPIQVSLPPSAVLWLILAVIRPLGAVSITSSATEHPSSVCLSLCSALSGGPGLFPSGCPVPGIVSETWSHTELVTHKCTSLYFYFCHVSWKLLTE